MSAQYPVQPPPAPSTGSGFTMQEVKKPTKFIVPIIGLVLALVIGWFFKDRIFPKPGTITVIGEGKVQAKPELVSFTVSWITQGGSAQEAISNEKSLFNHLVNLLKNNGVKESDIQVAHARVVPPGGDQSVFQAVNALDAKLNKINSFDQLTSSLYANGAVSVANVVLSTNNQEELEGEAITLAIQDAKGKAEQTAKASGKRLGSLVSLTSGATGEASAATTKMAGDAGLTDLSVPAGTESEQAAPAGEQIEIVKRVSVVYQLR